MRSAGRRRRAGRASADPRSGLDQRGGDRNGQPSRDTAGERRSPGTRPGRAVKVQPGSATDLLFNPAAEDYGEPLYRQSGDYGQPRRGRQPDDPYTPGQRKLDTAEYAKPLYPSFDSGPATDSRSRPAWPEDDPLRDTGAHGRSPSTPTRGRRGDRTGAQRRIAGSGELDTATGPQRTARTGPQRRAQKLSGPDPLTDSRVGVLWSESASAPQKAIASAPARRASTGPLGRLALESAEPLAEPLERPTAAPAPPGKPARKTRTGGQKAGNAKTSKSRARAGRGRKVTALLVGGLVIVAGVAAFGYFKLIPRATHTVTTPAALGAFSRQQVNATAKDLKQRILSAGAGNVKNVVAAVYKQTRGPGTSKGPQIVVFIGGNLTGNVSGSDLITAYMDKLHNAFTTQPGSLGGQAACAPGTNGSPSECAWADGDTFGVLVSATLNAQGLADELRQMRPLVEHVVK
jgi:hypothetical protein